MLKKLTVGKQIGVGFTVVLALLAIISGWSVFGISGIVGNASEVIEGNKLRGDMVQRELDHLNWANEVNDLLTNDAVTELHAQTDPRECAFGKWYYSEAAKKRSRWCPNCGRFSPRSKRRITSCMNPPLASRITSRRRIRNCPPFSPRKSGITWSGPTVV